ARQAPSRRSHPRGARGVAARPGLHPAAPGTQRAPSPGTGPVWLRRTRRAHQTPQYPVPRAGPLTARGAPERARRRLLPIVHNPRRRSSMLIEPLLQLLAKLKLHGMLGALQRQLSDPDVSALRFEERLNLLLQHELAERDNYRLTQRLRVAALPQPACLEDLDNRLPRNLDPALLATVRDLGWIGRHLNVLITGPTGIGKSFIAAALAHAACRANYCVRCFRLPRLIDELARAHAFQRRSSFLRSLARADLLLIDDFAIAPLSDQSKRDLLEILDDRYDKARRALARPCSFRRQRPGHAAGILDSQRPPWRAANSSAGSRPVLRDRAPGPWPPANPPVRNRRRPSSRRPRPQKAPCPVQQEDPPCAHGCCHPPELGQPDRGRGQRRTSRDRSRRHHRSKPC